MSDINQSSQKDSSNKTIIGNIMEESNQLKAKINPVNMDANEIINSILPKIKEVPKVEISSISITSLNNTTSVIQKESDITQKKTEDNETNKEDMFLTSEEKEKQMEDEEDRFINQLPKPQLNNKIDYVNYIEMEYPKIKINSQRTAQIKKKERPKYDEIQSEPLHKITDLIISKKIQVNTLKPKGNLLFVGDAFGKIMIYSLQKNIEERILYDKAANDTCVNCIEISDDGEVMMVGYANGILILWEIKTWKCKKIIDQVHTNGIIALKIFNKDKMNFEFFSSDCDGNVYKSVVKDRLITYQINSVSFIVQNKDPVYIIEMLDFTQAEKRQSPLCNFSTTVIIGCLKQIKLIMLEPDIKEIFSFEKPDDIIGYEIADVTFGRGFAPFGNDNGVENNKQYLQLAISWGQAIYLFRLIVDNKQIKQVIQIGYYINNKTILRLNFIAFGILIFFDSGKYFRAISTRDFIKGDITKQKMSQISNKIGRLIDSDMKVQTLFQDANQKWKATYLNFIVFNNNALFMMGKKTIYKLKLIKWEKCIEDISQDSTQLLSLSIDIYHGKQGALGDVPEDEVIRKRSIKEYLEKNIIVRSDLMPNEIEEYMVNIIELCLEIEMVDFLLNNAQNAFENYKDLFLRKLEPFILCDKMLKIDISYMNVVRIIDLYANNNQLHMLEQLLIHLNINSVDHDEIRSKCKEKCLINPLIYIHMNTLKTKTAGETMKNKKEYFEPVEKIYGFFQKKQGSSEFVMNDYKTVLKEKNLAEIKSAKEYIGYKLLWYISWCLKGIIFPTGSNMSTDDYSDIVLNIIPWLLSQKVFNEIIQFDCQALFAILKLIFGNQNLLLFLKNANDSSEMRIAIYSKLYTDDFEIKDIEPFTLLRLIKHQTEQLENKEKYLQCLNEFILKASDLPSVNNEMIMESVGYLLTSRDQSKLTDGEVIDISNDIMKVLENNNLLKEKDYYNLLLKAEKSRYLLVQLKLYEKDQNYKKCLELYLEETNNLADKKHKLFTWLDGALGKLSEGDKTTFALFKTEVLNNLYRIGALSMDLMCNMINKWFSADSKSVISKLDASPLIKLQYLDYIIERLRNKDHDILDEEESSMFLLQIQLLCELDKGNEIKPLLEKNTADYPLDKCLDLCIKYKVEDATVFLYQLTGAPTLALKNCLMKVESNFISIMSKLKDKTLTPDLQKDFFEAFQHDYNDCSAICDRHGAAHEDIWFEFLDKLYSLFNEVKTKTPSKTTSNIKQWHEFENMILGLIKKVLGMMCNYVSIISVISKVTKNSIEFKEMKESLVQIINDYSHQLNILGSARKLLSECVLKKESDLVKLCCKGYEYKINNCDLCEMELIERKVDIKFPKRIKLFFCGHKVHEICHKTAIGNHSSGDICFICKKTDIEFSGKTIEFEKPVESQSLKTNKIDPMFVKKMLVFDKGIYERHKLIIEESLM